MIDRARPGLVALYDIRPGNGAGLFLQPRSPHRAFTGQMPILSPKQLRHSITALKEKVSHCSSQAHQEYSQHLTTKGSWLPGGGLLSLLSAL